MDLIKKRPYESSTKFDMSDSNQLEGASNNPNSSKQKIITDTIPSSVIERNNLMQTDRKQSSSLKV
jgi:hypothetical protein